jgi:hypothetical protein
VDGAAEPGDESVIVESWEEIELDSDWHPPRMRTESPNRKRREFTGSHEWDSKLWIGIRGTGENKSARGNQDDVFLRTRWGDCCCT